MKTENEISMDYNKAISMTRELNDLAARYRRITTEDAVVELNRLASHWKGNNAEHFIGKVGKRLNSASAVADYLEKVAELIRQNAVSVYNAEMTALRIAQERSYN